MRLAAWMPATRATASTSPLVIGTPGDERRRLGLHVHLAPGDGTPVGRLLGRDVDHPGPAERVEVGEAAVRHGPRLVRCARAARPDASRSTAASAADLAHRCAGADERAPGRSGGRPTWRRRSAAMAAASSSSGAPVAEQRRAGRPRRPANRQDRSWPSAVSRTRSQASQNGAGHRRDHADLAARRRGSEPLGRLGAPRATGSSGKTASMAATISAWRTTAPERHRSSASSGMHSMNRTVDAAVAAEAWRSRRPRRR